MSKLQRATTEVPHQNLTISVPRDWMAELENWCKSQPVPPKRAAVIRLAVTQFIDKQRADQAARRRS